MLRLPAALVVAAILFGGTASAAEQPIATAVTAGLDHTCALTRAGAVKCWGYNGHDELGDGTGDRSSSSTPVPVQGLSSGVSAVAAGGRHSCAVQRGGALCWGANYFGALGDGIVQGQAGGREMRTAPLWGLRSTPRLLHDGSANSLEQAIARHDGQAAQSRARYDALDPDRRAALLAFLRSL